MTWICNCGLINGGTNKQCAGTNQKVLNRTEHYQISAIQPDWIMAVIASKGLEMKPEEELFVKFYSQGKIQVAGMSDLDLSKHIDDLQEIALEAKAKLQSALDERRDRNAKKTSKEWLVNNDRAVNVNVSDAINVVEKRKQRMNKMEKLTDDLRKAGIDESTIREMTRNLEAKASDSKLKTVVFKVPTTELKAVQIPTESANTEPKQVFDASSLSFKKGQG